MNHFLKHGTLFLLFFLYCVQQSPDDISGTLSEVETGKIAGICVNDQGNPLDQATVALYSYQDTDSVTLSKRNTVHSQVEFNTITTDASGRFVFDSVGTGSYLVHAWYADSLTSLTKAAITTGHPHDSLGKITNTLPGSETGSVDPAYLTGQSSYIMVKELGGRIPIEVDGRFIIMNVPAFEYSLRLYVDNIYQPSPLDSSDFSVTAGEPLTPESFSGDWRLFRDAVFRDLTSIQYNTYADTTTLLQISGDSLISFDLDSTGSDACFSREAITCTVAGNALRLSKPVGIFSDTSYGIARIDSLLILETRTNGSQQLYMGDSSIRLYFMPFVGSLPPESWPNRACDHAPSLPPTVSGPSGWTNDTIVTVTLQSSATGAGRYRYRCKDSTWIETTEDTIHLSLDDGIHVIEAEEQDSSGVWSTTVTIEIAVDATAPQPPVVSCPATPTSNDTAVFSWTSESDDPVSFIWGIDTVPSITTSAPACTTILAEGAHQFSVQETDSAGNLSPVAICSIFVDMTLPAPPDLECIGPRIFTATPSVQWTPEESALRYRFRTDAQDWDTVTETTITTGTLGAGAHLVEVAQQDTAGNWSSPSSCTLFVDLLPPEAVGIFDFTGHVLDESGNGYHATLTGATLTDDRHGNEQSAYLFNGDDSIALPSTDLFGGSDTFSLSFWVWIDSGAEATTVMNADGFTIGITDFTSRTANVPPGVTIAIKGTGGPAGSTTDTPLRTWHHIGVTYDGNRLGIYVNGVPELNEPIGVDMEAGGANIVIGSTFSGRIDDVRIYRRVLSAEEITELSLD